MPVHLGSMPLSVKAAIESRPIGPGDAIMLNDPYKGGTHLPDITLVSAVFSKKKLLFYVACRAHQSDIGGCLRVPCRWRRRFIRKVCASLLLL